MIGVEFFISTIRRYLGMPDAIVEVGCLYAGDTALLRHRFPESRVIGIDGNPAVQQYIERAGAEAVCAVVGRESKEQVFYVKEDAGLSGIYDRGSQYAGTVVRCRTETLAQVAKRLRLRAIPVLKIDAEGATTDVLLGAGEDLRSTMQVLHIETEDVPFFTGQEGLHTHACVLLSAWGFVPVRVLGAHIERGGCQYDSVWVRDGLLAAEARRWAGG